ncbi:MAG: PAS domain S-box protein, partial [Chloroflexi bacterium]|nr:PAS domain S-box protein [Chloroflexota bacterium]
MDGEASLSADSHDSGDPSPQRTPPERDDRAVLDALVENSDARLAYLDNDFAVVRANTSYAVDAGYSEPDEVVGRRHLDLFPGAAMRDACEKVRDAGEPVHRPIMPVQLSRHPEGGPAYWDWSLAPVRDCTGRVQGFVFSAAEVTERRRAELELERSREFCISLFDDFPALVWRLDADGRADYFNRTWLAFTGRTLQQERDGGWLEGVHPEDRDRIRVTSLPAFQARQSFEMEYRVRRRDGEYRWVLDRGCPFYDR